MSDPPPTYEMATTQSPPATGPAGDVASLLQNPAAFAQVMEGLEGQGDADEDIAKFVLSLPVPVKRRVQALKKLQLEAVKLEADFYKQVHDLECQFAGKFDSLHSKRKEIVNGEHEPSDVETDFPLIGPPDISKELGEKLTLENGDGEEATAEEDKNVKGVPEFWLTLLKNVDIVADMIQEQDEAILKHLTELEMKLSKPPEGVMGFTLFFHFATNDYFSNTLLTKEYTLRCDPEDSEPFEFDGPEIIACKGTKIDWRPGKNVTVKMIKKKQKHKQKGQTRFVTREVKSDSFFNFFDPPPIPESGADNLDEETRDLLNADFEIGQILRDRIIPRAVLYFTGEAHDDPFDEDEEDEFDEDEDDEDDEDEEDGPQQNNSPKKGGQDVNTSEKPQECQQQ